MSVCRVLLIDDDELSREILELLLGAAGYAVVPAASGEEALMLLRAGTAAEVVLADMQMPGICGAALALELRGIDGAGARILLAMSGSEPKPGALEGFDGFLLKPFTMEQLNVAIELGRRQPVVGELPMLTDSVAGDGEQMAKVLDEAKLEQLLVSFRPEQLDELFCFALTDAERQIETMRRAETDGDDVLYRRCAHSMKGSFGMLGAPQLRDLADLAEREGCYKVANTVTTFVLFADALRELRHTLGTRGICHG